MKIAIATEGNIVSAHFGKCENFTIIEVENSEIKEKTVVDTTGNQHGLLPDFLMSHGVETVIAGGMGDGAKQGLISKGIHIIAGISGEIDETIRKYLNGTLIAGQGNCEGHDHSHGSHECSCGNH